MSDDVRTDQDEPADPLADRDPAYVARLAPLLRLAVRTWFRSRVEGIERVPAGGALIVSNHSGGVIAMDVPVIAVAFWDHFGVDRPLYVLAHDVLFTDPIGSVMRRAGFLSANRANAEAVLRSGAVTILFPGGEYDAFRPVTRANTIDFAGRTGYVRTALETGVPLVPVVSHGGHEALLILSRGEWIARLLRLDKLLRLPYFPVSLGFPFGLTLGVFPPQLPLPTKIVTQVLEPIDVQAEIDAGRDVAAVDQLVRDRMQAALDQLASRRRFPVLG